MIPGSFAGWLATHMWFLEEGSISRCVGSLTMILPSLELEFPILLCFLSTVSRGCGSYTRVHFSCVSRLEAVNSNTLVLKSVVLGLPPGLVQRFKRDLLGCALLKKTACIFLFTFCVLHKSETAQETATKTKPKHQVELSLDSPSSRSEVAAPYHSFSQLNPNRQKWNCRIILAV